MGVGRVSEEQVFWRTKCLGMPWRPQWGRAGEGALGRENHRVKAYGQFGQFKVLSLGCRAARGLVT